VPSAIDTEAAGAAAARYVFLGAHTFAYIGGASSCLTSLFLLHTSNTVPVQRLHNFLVRSHAILWVPLGGIVLAVLCTSVANLTATLLVYGSYVALGIRLSVAVLWLVLVAVAFASLSSAASHAAGPRVADRAEAAENDAV
jgi:hypothetical protein